MCFAFDGQDLFSVLDGKPKRAPLTRLKRVRNILSNPQVALVVDRYDEDWRQLRYILMLGDAHIIDPGPEQRRAVALLREKYPQYRDMDVDENPVIKIIPRRFVPWDSQP